MDPGRAIKRKPLPPLYLLKSFYSCYRCKKESEVFSLVVKKFMLFNEVHEHPYGYSYITELSCNIKEAIACFTNKFYRDYSKTTKTNYYMNHCEHCGAKFGDWQLHNEPDQAFTVCFDDGLESRIIVTKIYEKDDFTIIADSEGEVYENYLFSALEVL